MYFIFHFLALRPMDLLFIANWSFSFDDFEVTGLSNVTTASNLKYNFNTDGDATNLDFACFSRVKADSTGAQFGTFFFCLIYCGFVFALNCACGRMCCAAPLVVGRARENEITLETSTCQCVWLSPKPTYCTVIFVCYSTVHLAVCCSYCGLSSPL